MAFRHLLLIATGIVLISAGRLAHAGSATATYTAAELRADLTELKRALHEMPPDLFRTADRDQLERAFRKIEAELQDSPPLDRDAAWRLFATLNPTLADGHLLVGFVDWRGDTRAHLAAGGVLFPFEVQVTPQCEIRVRATLGGRISPLENLRLRTINRKSAQQVCQEMLARAHGDTINFRADLLSRRFWFFYWKMFGAPAAFELDLTGLEGAQSFPGSTELPQVLADEASFERQFWLEALTEDTVALKLGTFAWRDKQQFLDFTRASFERMRDIGTKNLVIDLRDNGGGDDVMWLEGVMPYIATKAYRTGSTYRKRVVVADPEKGEVVGTVVDGKIETWYFPQPANPLRFKGKIYVVVGPGTYSSAVIFSNVVQEFGFGTVAGVGESVRADLSGGVRRTTLTHCGLIVAAPRFQLNRPSGMREPVLFHPNLYFDGSRPLRSLVSEDEIGEVVTTSHH